MSANKKTIMKKTLPLIHYSPWLSLTVLKSDGEGECGAMGSISGYEGMITCNTCRKLLEEERATVAVSAIHRLQQLT